MIPDDYENLSQSVIASEFFANNILLSLTTKNYWASANEYKPLLALWYLGILVQFFVLFPLIIICAKKIFKKISPTKVALYSLYTITLISIILYSLPFFSPDVKFYYLPFRIWELGLGASAFYLSSRYKTTYNISLYIVLIFILHIILSLCPKSLIDIDHINIVGAEVEKDSFKIPKPLLLITTVITSTFLLLRFIKINKIFSGFAFLGKMSLSLYIWHQVILAFLRYSFIETFTPESLLSYLALVFIVSSASYFWLEKLKITSNLAKWILMISWACVLCVSGYIYSKAGVLRDFPEMGVTTKNPYAVRNTEYIDRIYDYNKPYATDRIKVLVIGNSFARDLACCLEEWDHEKILEISYMPDPIKDDSRFHDSDYIFFLGDKKYCPQWVWDSIASDCKIYGIGTKYFGKTFGQFYRMKGTDSYYDSSVPVPNLLKKTNDEWKKSWGNNYIDFVSASLNEDGEIRIFTPERMIISFDCLHLSPAGASFFSSRLGLDEIFLEKDHQKRSR